MENICIYEPIKSNVKLAVIVNKGKENYLIIPCEKDYQNKLKLGNPISVAYNKIRDISYLEDFINDINKEYNDQIDELRSKLQSTKGSDYQEEHTRDLFNLKKRIQKVANNIAESDIENEDETFSNNLKEIYQLKKQLYSFENVYPNIAHKFNGGIKNDIKNLETQRDNRLLLLDLNALKKVMGE